MAASLREALPAPQRIFDKEDDNRYAHSNKALVMSSSCPPYGRRKGWVPRTQLDFGDGGAFPEIHLAQFPLAMGKKKGETNALAMQVNAEGNLKFDAIARQGHPQDKVIFSKFKDLVPKEYNEDELERPHEEEVEETTQKTREALEKIVQQKISAAMPVRAADKQAPAQYVRYTPSQQGVAYNSGSKQRIIRMVEVQKDPMEPPKFKINKKIPRGPPSPPAPVMHSPNRKVTVKEQQEWKIPPCISNWKNAKGFTIPLDKRLAADGRGLQSTHINENFAKLAESLYIADRKAREAVEMRAQMEKKMVQKEKEKKEEALRHLARQVREDRAGLGRADAGADDEVREREEFRKDRAHERQRGRNLARAGPEKRNKLDRDISEKIALGQPRASKDELQYDQRLFNQSKGMDSGFAGGEDESYNVYDRPWRKDKDMATSVYRPSRDAREKYGEDLDELMNTNRFSRHGEGTSQREGPVEFEKDDDPFGLSTFLKEAKTANKRASDSTRDSSRDPKRRKE